MWGTPSQPATVLQGGLAKGSAQFSSARHKHQYRVPCNCDSARSNVPTDSTRLIASNTTKNTLGERAIQLTIWRGKAPAPIPERAGRNGLIRAEKDRPTTGKRDKCLIPVVLRGFHPVLIEIPIHDSGQQNEDKQEGGCGKAA